MISFKFTDFYSKIYLFFYSTLLNKLGKWWSIILENSESSFAKPCGDWAPYWQTSPFLFQIIETMSFSSDVAAFMETLGPFYESIEEENDKENESSPADSGIELEAGNINALLGNFGKYY